MHDGVQTIKKKGSTALNGTAEPTPYEIKRSDTKVT
jgi:hypothetical protein